jgi:hypothetical protein
VILECERIFFLPKEQFPLPESALEPKSGKEGNVVKLIGLGGLSGLEMGGIGERVWWGVLCLRNTLSIILSGEPLGRVGG